jgi:hypothetical protein
MIRMGMGEEYPVDIMIGDSQAQQLMDVTIPEIDQNPMAVVLQQITRRITLQIGYRCPGA